MSIRVTKPESTESLREKIREYVIEPCEHGAECVCAKRTEWEWAVARVYELERQEEALTEMVRLSQEVGGYDLT